MFPYILLLSPTGDVLAETLTYHSTLEKLACVKPSVTVTTKGPSLGVTEREIEQMLFVALMAKLPRLKLDEACSNRLEVGVLLQDLSSSSLKGYSGLISLTIVRPAKIVDVAGITFWLTAWENLFLMHGPSETVRNQLNEGLNSLLLQFAEIYYRSDNP